MPLVCAFAKAGTLNDDSAAAATQTPEGPFLQMGTTWAPPPVSDRSVHRIVSPRNSVCRHK